MRTFTRLTHAALAVAALTVLVEPASALQRRDRERERARERDSQDWVEQCRDWDSRDRPNFCEIREQRLSDRDGRISIDGRQNGGVAVFGWERDEVLVRAKIQARGDSEDEARELASRIRIDHDGTVRADGPSGRNSWSVSYDVFVPRQFNVSARTFNGGIRVEDVSGRLELSAHNGGLSLSGVGGDVRGQTTNGGLHVELEGDRWEGEGLDLRTTNGGIDLSVPERYSARLETETTNGGMSIDFPVTVSGRLGRRLATELGSGGATLRVITTNGGVRVQRR